VSGAACEYGRRWGEVRRPSLILRLCTGEWDEPPANDWEEPFANGFEVKRVSCRNYLINERSGAKACQG